MSLKCSRRTIGWYRTAVPHEAIQALNKRSDLKGLLQIGTHITLIILTGLLAWKVQDRIYLLLPILFCYGTFYVFILNATHEMCHNSVFKTRFLNSFFLWLFCFLVIGDMIIYLGWGIWSLASWACILLQGQGSHSYVGSPLLNILWPIETMSRHLYCKHGQPFPFWRDYY